MFKTVIDTTDAESDYIAFNFWEYCNVNAGRINAYICRPMVEEGDTYNGWTLSQDDYDYIGGNMLDNTLSLDKSGTLYDVNGTLTPAGFGESTSIYKSFVYKLKGTVDSFSQLPLSGNVYDDTYYVRNDGTCYAYNGSEFVNVGNDYYHNVLEWRKGKPGAFTSFGLEANKDYVFSFMAKGTGVLTAYFYNPDTGVFVESSLGATNISVNGQANFQLTNKWERYWVHWRPSDSLHKYVLLRLNRSFQSDGGSPVTDCYIAQPKLEEGARVTEYTERKSDLVDKASLKAAGIEVTSEKVKLYGDQIEVKPKKDGNDVYALFGSDGFINTNILNVQHVYAKNTNGTVYGHFGYLGAEGGTDNAGNKYPLWVGASNVENAPFSVRSDGYMVTTSGRIGAWYLTERNLTTGAVVDSNYGTYMGTCLSMNEIDTANNINECKFLVAMGKGALYYDPFSPLKSGFYEDAKFRGNASERSDRYHVNSNNEHTYLSRSYYSSMYIKKEIGENSSSSRVDINQPALLVDSDGVGITSPGGNLFGGLAIGVLKAETTTDGQDASSSIREQLDDNRGAFVAINNAPGKITKFYLPKYPQEGQMLMVLQINSGTIQFYASNRKLMAFNNTIYQSGQYWTSLTQGQFSVFVYANGAWRIQFMNGR